MSPLINNKREAAENGVNVINFAVLAQLVNSECSSVKLYTCSIVTEDLNNQDEGINVLFNDSLNTFYYGYIGVRHMVKNYIHSETGNPLPPLRELLF